MSVYKIHMSASSKPIPIAIPNDLVSKIDLATSRMGKSKQEVMRIALSLGLLDLEQMNYDLEGHAWKALQAAKTLQFPVKAETKDSAQKPKDGKRDAK